MKKQNLRVRLRFTKKVIASLDARRLIGGTANQKEPEPLTYNSMCPVETCSCTDPKFDNCRQ
jgi:hypothetical protein